MLGLCALLLTALSFSGAAIANTLDPVSADEISRALV